MLSRQTYDAHKGVEAALISERFSRIAWGAVAAGVIITMSLQLFFSVLGSGIGLSLINREDTPVTALSIGAVVWWVITGSIAYYAGGWVSGRMAGIPRRMDATLHGVLTWGVGLLVTFLLLTTTLGAAMAGAFGLLKEAGNALPQMTGSAAQGLANATGTDAGFGAEMRRLFEQRGANRPVDVQAMEQLTMTAADLGRPENQDARKGQAVNILMRQTNMSEREARSVVDRWTANAQALRQKAEDTAAKVKTTAVDTSQAAGKTALVCAFILLLGMMISAAGGAAGAPHWSQEEVPVA